MRVLILQFYSDKSTGEMLPGKKGISLSVEQVCAGRYDSTDISFCAAADKLQWKALRGSVDQIDDIINDLE